VRAIIGAKLIASQEARPSAKPYEIRDTRLPGFLLRVQPSGARSYYAQHGRGRRTLIGAVGHFTPDEARERCEKILGNTAHGRPPLAGLDGAAELTLGDFIGKEGDDGHTYRKWLTANKPKSAAATLQRLETHFGAWYSRPLTDISVDLIETWRTKRLSAGRSPHTVLRDVMTLSGVLTRAVKAKKLNENPIRAVEKPKIDRKPKVRFLDKAEEKRLRDALAERDAEMRAARESANEWRRARKEEPLPTLPHYGDHLTPAVILSMNTGLRNGELVALRWLNIDFKSKQLTIEGGTAKSEQTRYQPLNSEALEALKRWQKQSTDSERVFPIARFKTAWNALLERAHITKFRWHDLRHHFASRLVQEGVPLNTVRELLGHGSLAMTLRYAHLAPDQKIDAVAKLVRQ
jgi:integrase